MFLKMLDRHSGLHLLIQTSIEPSKKRRRVLSLAAQVHREFFSKVKSFPMQGVFTCIYNFLGPKSSKYLKWFSTSPTSKTPPKVAAYLENNLRMFFDSNNNRKDVDYVLALVSALKSCSSLLAISPGEQIHCLISKSGLQANIFILNTLINFYAKCGFMNEAKLLFDSCSRLDSVSWNIIIGGYIRIGCLDYARQLFDVMPSKGCVSYTTMISGLAKSSHYSEAIDVFKNMRADGVVPTEVTMSSVISAYSHFGGAKNGQMLHGLVVKIGLDRFVLALTNLVLIYCNCSNLQDARSVFDEMSERNIVAWNIMLNGYSKAGFLDLACELFEKFPTRDVVSWGTLIDGHVRLGKLYEALMMYGAMLSTGLRPNEVMIVDILSACGQAVSYFEGQQFHSTTIKRGLDCYDFMQSTIIHFYASCQKIDLALVQFKNSSKKHLASWNAIIAGLIRNQMIEQARQLFDEMPDTDIFSWSSMISGYSQTNQPVLALELFQNMIGYGLKANEITMVSVLSAVASLGSLQEAKWAYEYIKKNSIAVNDNLLAAVVDMYAKCGSINTALQVFDEMQDNISTISPWNAIICGLAMHGHAELSLQIFSRLQNRNIKLNSITFIGVLSACCHAGLVEEGKKHLENMKSKYNVEPNIKHYGCMVDLYGRLGRLKEAEELIRKMPMKADVVIWGTLLAASRTYADVEVGERAAIGLASVEPSHGGSKVLMSNIYADAGRWDDVFSIRRAMQTQNLIKTTGYSGVN